MKRETLARCFIRFPLRIVEISNGGVKGRQGRGRRRPRDRIAGGADGSIEEVRSGAQEFAHRAAPGCRACRTDGGIDTPIEPTCQLENRPVAACAGGTGRCMRVSRRARSSRLAVGRGGTRGGGASYPGETGAVKAPLSTD